MSEKRENDEVLSFEELKNRYGTDENYDDKDISEVLESLGLGEKDTPKSEEKVIKEDIKKAETKSHEIATPPAQKAYENVLPSTNEDVSEKNTARHNKYVAEQNYIDVTDMYQKKRPPQAEVEVEVEVEQPVETQIQDEEITKKSKKEKKQKKIKEKKSENKTRGFNEMFKGWMMSFVPKKTDKVSEIVRKLIMDISIITLIGCTIYYGDLLIQKQEAKKQQTKIQDEVGDDTDEADAWAEFYAKYPNQKLPEGMMAKYAYLYAINNDLVGWVKIPNSIIDVQVVKSPNNSDYLKKDFYGNYSRYGCPFMDYRNDVKNINKNTIVYGHHMSDGLVFAELAKFKTVDGFKESPIIEFDTLYKRYKFKVYAAFITNSIPSQDNDYVFNYIATSFKDGEDFNNYIKAIDERKLYTTGVDIDEDDKIITLSTCSYEFKDAKFAVVGRLLRDGESEKVDVDKAMVNENPHYPQVWYDKKGTKNPFIDFPKWVPTGKKAENLVTVAP
ncbi:MAG: class B sortase [Oscillospiraceae bacterium]